MGGLSVGAFTVAPLPPVVFRLACAALCTAYVASGVTKLLDFDAALGEAVHFGLQPPALFAIGVILTQLVGSALTVFASGRWQALGAAALAGFTIVATLIGHPFWTMEGMDRFHNRNSFLEHIGLVGGFLLVGALAWPRRGAAA
ncbi:DoxX family protein [Panacagrimonas perspica]|nr:DoxX family protein [Panacagrimonas perspica]